MRFIETGLSGAFIIEAEPIEDERGFFATTFTVEAFEEHGLETQWVQFSVSHNRKKGTLRGMHLQREPFQEMKLVRCTAGSIYDVALDLRPDSPSFLKWAAVELTPRVPKLLYLPKGMAHGFQTLEDNSEVSYQISTPYRPEAATGVRWNDPAFAIRWPLPVSVISARDRSAEDFRVPPAGVAG